MLSYRNIQTVCLGKIYLASKKKMLLYLKLQYTRSLGKDNNKSVVAMVTIVEQFYKTILNCLDYQTRMEIQD